MELIFNDKNFLLHPSRSGIAIWARSGIAIWAHTLQLEYNRNNNISFKKLGSQVEIDKEYIHIWEDTEIWIKGPIKIIVNAETLEEKL